MILNHVDAPVGVDLSRDVRLFFRLLRDVVTRDDTVQESFVDDFSLHLLGLILRLDEPNRVFHQLENFHFIMCGREVDARPNIVLHDSDDRILLLVQNKVSVFSFLLLTTQPHTETSLTAPVLSRLSRASASGLRYSSVPHRRFQTHRSGASADGGSKVYWHRHDWGRATFLQGRHHARPC